MMRLNKTNGLSFIEVLISLLLISLIFFVLDGAQFYVMKEAKAAYFFGMAINQINNAAERLTALKEYEGLDEQLIRWNAENQTVLPDGFGTISGHYPNYLISIYWGTLSHDCAKQKIGLSGCLRRKIQLA